jgi:hypothetical protein
MTEQRRLLLEIATRHGVKIGQAEEVWNLLGGKIAEVIADIDKKSDEFYDKEKFPVIHIDNFGKFIPNQRKIRHANHCLNLKIEKDEHNI